MGVLGPYSASSNEDNQGQPASSPTDQPSGSPRDVSVNVDISNQNLAGNSLVPTMSNESSGRGSSRSTKRGSQDHHHYSHASTSPTGSSSKRPRISSSSGDGAGSFSRAERMILENAADILSLPLERLLAAAELASNLGIPSEHHTPASSAGDSSARHLQTDAASVAPASASSNVLLVPPARARSREFHRQRKSRSRSQLSRNPSTLDTIQARGISDAESISQSNVPSWLENLANETPQSQNHEQHAVASAASPAQRGSQPSTGSYPEHIDYSSSDFVGYTPAATTTSGSPASLAVPPLPLLPGSTAAGSSIPSSAQHNIVVRQHTEIHDFATALPSTGPGVAYQSSAAGMRGNAGSGDITLQEEQDDDESSETPVKGEHNDSSDGGKSRNARGKRSGPFQDIEKRQETGVTRKVGACIRCSMQRIRCNFNPEDPNGCCLTCIQATRTRMYWLPCLRYRVSEAELLDHVGAPRASWTLRWKKMAMTDIKGWQSRTIKTITVTQDVGGAAYDFRVRRFAPVAGDSLARRWRTGQVAGRGGREEAFECAPYGIASMREAGATLTRVVNETLEAGICHYVDESDRLLRNTYLMAHRYSIFAEREEERDLLKAALRLWNGCRMESRSERICGSETLGMAPHACDDKKCPNQGLVLLPPVFSAQLEVVMTVTVLAPAKQEVLKRLKELIQENQRRSWFAIYLCIFILLHSCSMLTAGDNAKARKQGLEARFLRHSIVEGLHNGAKILLAYFHYCNKGGHPFAIDWTSPDQVARAEFNGEQVQFMRETVQELSKRVDLFRRIRQEGMYEHDYYFLSQLYDFDWKPTSTI